MGLRLWMDLHLLRLIHHDHPILTLEMNIITSCPPAALLISAEAAHHLRRAELILRADAAHHPEYCHMCDDGGGGRGI